MQKVLVTGATGFIGSHTIVQLLEKGYSVVGIDNLANSTDAVLGRIGSITGKKITFRKGDIRDRSFLTGIFEEFQFDAVIHFAGYKAVGESVQNPQLYFSNNLAGSQLLFEVMGEFDVKHLVFSSSCTVYGDPETVPLDESATRKPTNPYGRTKYWIEQMLEDICHADDEWQVLSLRYFNPVGAHPSGLIGEDPSGIPNNLVPFITQTAIGLRDELKIFGNDYDTPDGTCIRDYIHVVDLADGHIKALEKLDRVKGFKPVNLGTGRGVSVLEMVETFAEVNEVEVPYTFAERRPGDAAKVWAATGLANDFLNWRAQKDVKQMLSDSWNWQKSNPKGYQK